MGLLLPLLGGRDAGEHPLEHGAVLSPLLKCPQGKGTNYNIRNEGGQDGSSARLPVTHAGHWDCAPGSWLRSGPLLAIVGIRRVNQWMEDLYMSVFLSFKEYTNSKIEKKIKDGTPL